MHPLFIEYMQQRWPDTVPALATQPTLSVRLNPAKLATPAARHTECAATGLRTAATDGLPTALPLAAPVPWHGEGYYLSERPNFTLDPALHQGLYYVQDASSMLVGTIAARLASRLTGGAAANGAEEQHGPSQRSLLYLDACAAPGGKTTAAVAALPPDAIVFANEYDYRRANILSENLAKWGSPRCVVTRGDTARYRKLRDTFDIIAVDAPCSGEGMMRKDPQAAAQWTPGLVRECADRQVEILTNLWQALKPGGYLIYSTCTFNEAENEGTVQRLGEQLVDADDSQRMHSVDIAELLQGVDLPGVTRDGNFLRFLPGRARGEGLCVTVLRKGDDDCTPAATAPKPKKNAKANKAQKGKAQPKLALPMLPDGYVPAVDTEGRVTAMPADMATIVTPLLSQLDVLCAGVEVGTVKGKDLIPAQPLALCTALDSSAYPKYEVTLEQALQYLRRDTLTLDADCPRGIVLLTYCGRPLGFAKHLGNRTNNLYPAEWRIRMAGN